MQLIAINRQRLIAFAFPILFYLILPTADYLLSTYAWSKGFIEFHALPKQYPFTMIVIPFAVFYLLEHLGRKIVRNFRCLTLIRLCYLCSYFWLFAYEAQSIYLLFTA